MEDDMIEAIGGKRKKSVQDIFADFQRAQGLEQTPDVAQGASVAAAANVNANLISNNSVRLSKSVSSANSVSENGQIPIAPPKQSEGQNFRALIERWVMRTKLETALANQSLSQARLQQNAEATEWSHEKQFMLIEKQVDDAAKSEKEAPLTKVSRWLGAASALFTATLSSIASGGATTGLVIAAAAALAMAIGEESGAFKAIEREISKTLQKEQGMSKKDADEAAGYIMQAIQLAMQVAGDIAGGYLKSASEETAKKIASEGMKVVANSTVGDLALENAAKLGTEDAAKVKEIVQKAVSNVAEKTQKIMQEAAEKGVKIADETVEKAAETAVHDLTAELRKLKLDKATIEKVMSGVEKDATAVLKPANTILQIQKWMNRVGDLVGVARSGWNTSDEVNQFYEQKEMQKVDASLESTEAEKQLFLQKFSAENDTLERSQNQVNELEDAVIEMAQSTEDSRRQIVETMV